MRSHVHADHQHRFTPVSMDVHKLSYESLDDLTKTVWGVPLQRVDVIHHSPMCQSLSSASKQGHTEHFTPDYDTPTSDMAKYHLECLEAVFGIFARLTSEGYKGVISAENPYGGCSKLRAVTDMCKLPGWRLITQEDHCSNTCELDTRDFPNKPTTYLVFNTLPTLELKRCKQDCPFRLPNAPDRHRLLICGRRTAAPGQRVIRSVVDKSRVPLAFFSAFFGTVANTMGVIVHSRQYGLTSCISP